jgi:LysR family transcriptional regulator, glycine cleavage system transcriptional activator
MQDRHLPSLNAVRSFAVAARHQSFTGAARELCVTQGAVSRMVRTLETELGVKLFHRVGRAVELTAAGIAYYQQVAEALERIATATRSVRALDGAGVLRICCLPTLAMRWLVPRLSAFEREHLAVLVDVVAGDWPIDFAAQRIDVGICLGTGTWAGAEATRVMGEQIGVFCAPAVVERGPPLRGPQDLPLHRLIQHTTRPDAWLHYFDAFGVPRPARTPATGFEHFFMIMEAAASGLGLALLPLFLAQAEVAAGRLVQPFPHVLRPPHAYYIVHPPGAGRVSTIRLFKEWLLRQAASAEQHPGSG